MRDISHGSLIYIYQDIREKVVRVKGKQCFIL